MPDVCHILGSICDTTLVRILRVEGQLRPLKRVAEAHLRRDNEIRQLLAIDPMCSSEY